MLGAGAPRYHELMSTVDLCPTCVARLIEASGCKDKIETKLPAPMASGGQYGVGIVPGRTC